MAYTITNAVEQFFADYDRLPFPSGPLPYGGDRDTDTSPFHGFTSILLGKEGAGPGSQNPRNIDYLDGLKIAIQGKDPGIPWRNGLVVDPTTGSYAILDAYGTPYRVRLDTNNDKSVANPNTDQVAEGRPTLPRRVIVWSTGKDRDWTTWKDNPKSWE